jgi:uncharacterized YigZ family protein
MASTDYLVPSATHRVQETIKRSRFITTVSRAPGTDEAQAFIAEIKKEFPDATHNCWAFVAGPPGDTAHIGMSDDGEPHGSAGRPMLTTLLHSEVGQIVAVGTRYYGGVKLGTGGLSRAYSGGITLALQTLPTQIKVDRVEVVVSAAYTFADALRRRFGDFDVRVNDETFGADVRWRLGVPVAEVDPLRMAVADLTNGAGVFESDSH